MPIPRALRMTTPPNNHHDYNIIKYFWVAQALVLGYPLFWITFKKEKIMLQSRPCWSFIIQYERLDISFGKRANV